MRLADNILGARSKWKQAAKVKRTLTPNAARSLEAGLGNNGHLRHGYTEPTDYKPRTPITKPDSSNGPNADNSLSSAEPMKPGADGEALRNRRSNGNAEGPDAGAKDKFETGDEDKKLEKQVSRRFYRPVHPREPFTWSNQVRRTLFGSWLNILLLAAPAGIGVGAAGLDGRIVFGVNFVAIIPLAALLSDATEEIALRTGESIGGLINATFGYVCSSTRTFQRPSVRFRRTNSNSETPWS